MCSAKLMDATKEKESFFLVTVSLLLSSPHRDGIEEKKIRFSVISHVKRLLRASLPRGGLPDFSPSFRRFQELVHFLSPIKVGLLLSLSLLFKSKTETENIFRFFLLKCFLPFCVRLCSIKGVHLHNLSHKDFGKKEYADEGDFAMC